MLLQGMFWSPHMSCKRKGKKEKGKNVKQLSCKRKQKKEIVNKIKKKSFGSQVIFRKLRELSRVIFRKTLELSTLYFEGHVNQQLNFKISPHLRPRIRTLVHGHSTHTSGPATASSPCVRSPALPRATSSACAGANAAYTAPPIRFQPVTTLRR